MYSGLSIVISLGLILILILTHYNLKSKLFNFENVLKNNEHIIMNKIKKMTQNLDNNYSKFIGPIDCEGRWVCNEKCIREFEVDILPKFGGSECPTGSAPESGLGSCIPGSGSTDDDCPLHQDCQWSWSKCGSNCKREVIVDVPSSGNGATCPNYNDALKVSEELKNSNIDNDNRIYKSCINEEELENDQLLGANLEAKCKPSVCEGNWGSCGSNCQQEWVITKESTPANEYQNYLCPNRYISQKCAGDFCENKDCEWYWTPCYSNNKRYKRPHKNIERSIVITKEPVGNGSSCPTLEWENNNMKPCN